MSTLTESQREVNQRQLPPTKLSKALSKKHRAYLIGKRALDLVICISLLPVILCMIAVIGVFIALDSPGSPFFAQERVGKDGRRFRMYKFRTLSQDYDNPEHRSFMQAFVLGETSSGINSLDKKAFKPPLQKHITRFGRILRKSSLDELPQIFNVLKGDMSLVGPRPNVTWEVEKYKDWHCERLHVLPGITGLAQVRGRSSITFDSIVLNDLEYIERQSLKLDLQILWWTLVAVMGGRGAG
jgi:lipopolysaccharide/colanic/teichoic acid biosynthesis glycosyltransferase